MSIYSFCRPKDLMKASTERFGERLQLACREFSRLSYGRISTDHAAAVLKIVPNGPDTPQLRAWAGRVERLASHQDLDAGLYELAAAHPSFDRPDLARVLELVAWEALGLCASRTVRSFSLASRPPQRWAVGTTGTIVTSPLDQGSQMVSVLLPSAQRVRLQSEGTTAVELQVEQHPRSSGEFTCTSPIGDWFLARSAGLDFPIIRSRSYIDGWLPLLACAAGAIRTYSECAHAWIVQLVSAALPVASQGDSVGSASREEMLGLVYLPGTSLFDQLVECLLHEAMHQLLFRLEECGPLFSEDDGREVYYSPWRSDPRPLRMILHGAFVFTAVADLYSKLGPTVLEVSLEESHARAYLRSLQARCALATVTKHGKMTRFGQEVIRAIGHTLDSLPQPTPQKAECRAVEAALTCHRNDHAHYMS